MMCKLVFMSANFDSSFLYGVEKGALLCLYSVFCFPHPIIAPPHMGGACIAVLTFGEWGSVYYCGKLVDWVFFFLLCLASLQSE